MVSTSTASTTHLRLDYNNIDFMVETLEDLSVSQYISIKMSNLVKFSIAHVLIVKILHLEI